MIPSSTLCWTERSDARGSKEVFGCVQSFVDTTNKETTTTCCKSYAWPLLVVCQRQGNERTSSTSFSSKSMSSTLHVAKIWGVQKSLLAKKTNNFFRAVCLQSVHCVCNRQTETWVRLHSQGNYKRPLRFHGDRIFNLILRPREPHHIRRSLFRCHLLAYWILK